jgi:O-antigen/teichoic acid export membrane protein
MAQAVEILRWEQLRRWSFTLAEFGAVQIAVQALTALAGILIIRSMSKPEYALFAIANSMQTTCNLLADLGIGIGVRSIGGKVWADPFRFGQLMNTALGLRRKFAICSLGVCLPIAGWMLWRNGATPFYAVVLCAVVGAGVIPLLSSSVWGVSPGLHGEYRRMQKLDLGNAALRLFLIGALTLTRLSAWLAALVGVVTNWIQSLVLRRWAREKADFLAPPNADDRRELTRLSVKSLPNAIFFCFQGQVTLLILTLVGSPTGIADVTALGRIAMLFSVFSVAFASVLGPRFARCQDPARLPRLYLLLVGGMVLAFLPLMAFAWLLPELFLWLLGGKYAGLESECGWVIAACCVTQIGSVMWYLNSSKAWVRAHSVSFIPMILTAQAMIAIYLNLGQFHNVLIFNLVTAVAPLPAYALDAWLGIRSLLRRASVDAESSDMAEA